MLQWLGMPKSSCDSPSSPWGLPSVPVVVPVSLVPVVVVEVAPEEVELAPLPELALVELEETDDVESEEPLLELVALLLDDDEPESELELLSEPAPAMLPLPELELEPLSEPEPEVLLGLTAYALRASAWAGSRAEAMWRRARGSQIMGEL